MQIEIDLDAILERLKAELGPLEGVSPFHKMSHFLLKTEKFITYASEEPIWVF